MASAAPRTVPCAGRGGVETGTRACGSKPGRRRPRAAPRGTASPTAGVPDTSGTPARDGGGSPGSPPRGRRWPARSVCPRAPGGTASRRGPPGAPWAGGPERWRTHPGDSRRCDATRGPLWKSSTPLALHRRSTAGWTSGEGTPEYCPSRATWYSMATPVRCHSAKTYGVTGSGRSAGRSRVSKSVRRQPGRFRDRRLWRGARRSRIAAFRSAKVRHVRCRRAARVRRSARRPAVPPFAFSRGRRPGAARSRDVGCSSGPSQSAAEAGAVVVIQDQGSRHPAQRRDGGGPHPGREIDRAAGLDVGGGTGPESGPAAGDRKAGPYRLRLPGGEAPGPL